MSVIAPQNPIMERIWDKAQAGQKRIVLPESTDSRTLLAAEMIVKANLSQVILIGKEDEIGKLAKEAGANIDGIPIIDPAKSDKLDGYAQTLFELRKGKIPTVDDARQILQDYLYFGVTMVKVDDADGMVAGALNTTADVLRPAFQIIKTVKGISVASACFAMFVPNCPYGENGFFLYADSGGHPNPNEEELADIAISTCLTMKNIFGIEEPRAAMLSFSTKGSGSHAIVDKVIAATKIANQKRPDFLIDGELQGDAALIPEIGKKKAPGSPVAGRANILIFPDLNCGNIAYKLTERLAQAEAYGPLLQGLAKPINDLSRGCKPSDIANTVAIVAVRAMVPYGESQ
jgi:phosphate acetyltransferase